MGASVDESLVMGALRKVSIYVCMYVLVCVCISLLLPQCMSISRLNRQGIANTDNSHAMGLIDSLYILSDTNRLLFEQIFTPSCPSFAYVRTQLEAYKKESLVGSESSAHSDIYSDSLFVGTNGQDLNSLIKLDSTYLASWAKFGNFYIVIVGTIPQPTVDVVSDDDESDDEEEEGYNTEKEDRYYTNAADGSRHADNGYAAFQDSEEDEQEREEVNPFADSNDKPTEINHIEPESTTYKLSNAVHPIQYLSFLKTFYEILEAFLISPITQHKIETNAHNIMLLLQEIVDADTPYVTDINQLRELLPNNSIINQIISTTKHISKTATTSINNMAQNPSGGLQSSVSLNSIVGGGPKETHVTIFQKSGNNIPWRRMNVKNAQNELLVDVKETLTMVIPPKKRTSSNDVNVSSYYSSYSQPSRSRNSKATFPVVAKITGRIEVTSSLAGIPQLAMNMNLQNHDLGVPAFHKCVNIENWCQTPGYLTFVPPDESFTLMEYTIDLLNNGVNSSTASDVMRYSGLVDVELITGLGMKKNEFEIKVNTTALNTVQKIDQLRVEILLNDGEYNSNELPNSYTIRSLRMTHGDLQQTESKNFEWVFEKTLALGVNCTFKGIIISDNDSEQENGYEEYESSKILRPSMLNVHYSNKESIPSGLKIGSININRLDQSSSNLPKPYKGVKYITEIGNYIVR